MGNSKWFSAQLLFKEGVLRETAKALLRELWLEDMGGEFPESCWTVPGGRTNSRNYKVFTWGKKNRLGHRLAYQVFTGEIPKGHQIMHACDNPPCCNPAHLSTGTAKQNAQDKMNKDRHRGNGYENKTHCPQGHEYSEENTYLYQDRRYCRTCHRKYTRESARKRRALLKQNNA